MTKRLPSVLDLPREAHVRMRLCEDHDQNLLRTWKNKNRQFFFFKEEISAEQQQRWFESYQTRGDDHMYMVEESVERSWVAVGVVGIRLLLGADTLDAYNIMRGARTAANLTNMGRSFRRVCDVAASDYGMPVTCKVIIGNPALAWYKAIGFRCASVTAEYELLQLVDGDL